MRTLEQGQGVQGLDLTIGGVRARPLLYAEAVPSHQVNVRALRRAARMVLL